MEEQQKNEANPTTTRREFLAKGTAAGVGLSLTSAASYARILGANDRIRTGHIGIGNRGTSLMEMVLEGCPSAQVVALCDLWPPYLENAKSKAGAGAKTYTDYRKLLEDNDVDAVVIGTPDHWHALQFIDACRAGKDIYVEKPLSLTISEGRAMIDAARQNDRVTQMGAQRHSSPYVVEACKFLREGGIGKITRVRCFHLVNEFPMGIGKRKPSNPPEGLDWDMWLGPAPKIPFDELVWNYKFRWFWNYSGGQVTNMGTHYLDVIQMGLGQEAPKAVMAMGGKFAVDDDREIPDTMEAVWHYDNCLVSYTQVNSNSARMAPPGTDIEFRGTNGTMIIYGDRWEVVPEDLQDSSYVAKGPLNKSNTQRKKVIEPASGKGTIDQVGHLNNFFECIRTRAQCACDVEVGHRPTTTSLMANLALKTETHLKWDAKAEKFTNSEEANKLLSYEYRAPWTLAAKPKKFII